MPKYGSTYSRWGYQAEAARVKYDAGNAKNASKQMSQEGNQEAKKAWNPKMANTENEARQGTMTEFK